MPAVAADQGVEDGLLLGGNIGREVKPPGAEARPEPLGDCLSRIRSHARSLDTAALLRTVLGHPDRKHAGTPTGDGVLLRLLSGEPLDSLRCDSGLLAEIWAAKPDRHGNS